MGENSDKDGPLEKLDLVKNTFPIDAHATFQLSPCVPFVVHPLVRNAVGLFSLVAGVLACGGGSCVHNVARRCLFVWHTIMAFSVAMDTTDIYAHTILVQVVT